MAYSIHNFKKGDVIYASDINEMDTQIKENETNIGAMSEDVSDLQNDVSDIKTRVDTIEKEGGYLRYGVSGIEGSASTLTRLWDAVGMTAQVGTDGDNSNVINDFDYAPPFMRRKCVGEWTLEDGKAVFHVRAYKGDANYAEDGSMGDYVAVECPLCYYKYENGTLGISAHQYEGWRPFDVFCTAHDVNRVNTKIYLPAYALALKNGKAVSLPDLDNEQGDYKGLMDKARTYKGGALGGLAYLQQAAVNFYEWALFTVEFATQNCQSIMQGCEGLRHVNDDVLTFKDSTHAVASGWYTPRVVGEYIAILPSTIDVSHSEYKATHKILSITRCDASGSSSASGTYTLLELENLGKNYWAYDYTGGTNYKIAGRPYRTGACNSVSTPSGSPVSNTDSFHPMKYRHRENVYGNQYNTTSDLFNARVGTGDSDYSLDWYLLKKPEELYPAVNPSQTTLTGEEFEVLDIITEHTDYANGYVKSKKHSVKHPDIWIPHKTSGASASTYYCDYAYLVNSTVVRSVRFGGSWHHGASAGFSLCSAITAPSYAYASFGGSLCFAQ